MPLVITQRDHKDIRLSEINQTDKHKYSMP